MKRTKLDPVEGIRLRSDEPKYRVESNHYNKLLREYNRHITVESVTANGGTCYCDFKDSLNKEVTLNASTLFVLRNLYEGDSFSIAITNAGGFTGSFESTVHWEGGVDPTMSAATGAVDLITGINNGTVNRCGILQDIK